MTGNMWSVGAAIGLPFVFWYLWKFLRTWDGTLKSWAELMQYTWIIASSVALILDRFGGWNGFLLSLLLLSGVLRYIAWYRAPLPDTTTTRSSD